MTTTTVAQLLYFNPPGMALADLLGQLLLALRSCPEMPAVHRDDDQTVTVDLLGNRIILRWTTCGSGDHRAWLSVAVGNTPGQDPGGLARRQDIVARLIADRVARDHHPDLVLWHHESGELTPALIDRLSSRLPSQTAARVAREIDRLQDMARLRDSLSATQWAPANDMPNLPSPQLVQLARVRRALQEDAEVASVKLRLAAQAINATMVCVSLPVGAAVMAYSFLRGENINASARILALLGLAVGAQNTGIGPDVLGL
jgi:hypothetical protein